MYPQSSSISRWDLPLNLNQLLGYPPWLWTPPNPSKSSLSLDPTWKTFSRASSAAQLTPRSMASGDVSMAKHTEGTKGLRDMGQGPPCWENGDESQMNHRWITDESQMNHRWIMIILEDSWILIYLEVLWRLKSPSHVTGSSSVILHGCITIRFKPGDSNPLQ